MLSTYAVYFLVLLSLLGSGTAARHIPRVDKRSHDLLAPKRTHHAAQIQAPAVVSSPHSSNEASKKAEEGASKANGTNDEILTDDTIRGRGSITRTQAASYAKIQPQKSLIGAAIAFAIYFLGTMVYNYIIIEKERIAKALQEYEEEKEHFIETGETVAPEGTAI
ncbi:hypothetical protein BgAZ_300310 [Babesia gibsoni]|uniref:Transmembrane protein n=1 Tax=Babesia gibsoni TaxID=33632 RepID=A0AAD8LJC8_BABGI|nr:hypothetical protein BgAZ_300310 [Babesia gibsoni]